MYEQPAPTELAGETPAVRELAGGAPAIRAGRGVRSTLPPPPWQQISGLTPDAEAKFTRSERRYALRKLFKHYEALVRAALAEHDSDPEKDERSFLWEPLPMICIELGIARKKLSALTRELTGMAAHEVIDKIRAEGLAEKLDQNLAALFKKLLTPGASRYGDVAENEWEFFLWRRVKKNRRAPYFTAAQWALQHGFANYARFRRGCMLAHQGRTPHELEFESIKKYAAYFSAARSLLRRKDHLRDYQVRERDFGQPCNDLWSRATAERPEWLSQMREKFGLCEKLEPLAARTTYLTKEEWQAQYDAATTHTIGRAE